MQETLHELDSLQVATFRGGQGLKPKSVIQDKA